MGMASVSFHGLKSNWAFFYGCQILSQLKRRHTLLLWSFSLSSSAFYSLICICNLVENWLDFPESTELNFFQCFESANQNAIHLHHAGLLVLALKVGPRGGPQPLPPDWLAHPNCEYHISKVAVGQFAPTGELSLWGPSGLSYARF